MTERIDIDADTSIPLSEIELRASRSSGPGGQHANVTASRIEAVFDVAASQSLSDEQKRRLTERLGRCPSAVAQDSRSQAQNRELALTRLQIKIAEALKIEKQRQPTKPSRAGRLKRLAAKKNRAERKRLRRRPSDDD